MLRRTWSLFLSLLVSGIASGAEPVSLADVVRAVLRDGADVRAAELAVDMAAAQVSAARAVFDPTFTTGADVSGGRSSSFLAGFETSSRAFAWSTDTALSGELPTGTSYELGSSVVRQHSTTTSSLGGESTDQQVSTWAFGVDATVRQDLFAALRPTSAQVALRTAREAKDVEALRALDIRQATLASVTSAWAGWQVEVAAVDVRARRLATAEALEASLMAQLDEGVVTAADVGKVRADRLGAQADLAAAGASARDAGDRLLVQMGRSPGVEVEPAGEFPRLPEVTATLAVHLAEADARSPALALARLQATHSDAALRDAWLQALPSLTVDGSAGVATLAGDARAALLGLADSDSALPTYGAGLTLTVPLGGRAAAAARAKAEASRASISLASDDGSRSLAADVVVALRAVRTAETSVTLARARLEAARAVADAESARADEGLVRVDQRLDALAAVSEAELAVLDQEAALRLAVVELMRLEGSIDALLVQG